MNKSKTLIINSCAQCPHNKLRLSNAKDDGDSILSDLYPCCYNENQRGKIIKTLKGIPDWCPLPDAKEEKS